ncbi:protein kinase [Nonomuraea sp. NPDC046570]|uniref:serine/threonine-protein kinase n=1 Tax=Nonomuraea sp. NPDC046570 TaxID=3155255 RepID=UPI0033CA04E4
MHVPGYHEVRELGHGGSGVVMLAVRDSDRLPVAIKHLSRAHLADEEFVRRFRTEAHLIATLDSPYIARLLDYREDGGDAAIVMELVDGVTLRHLLREEGATGPEAALTVLKGALLGLAAAHRAGVVHRDFKPENVIVTADGGSKLVDFGVAARSGETGPGVGTPPYMAPEQWQDAPASPEGDVYAATVVFFECLTGSRPFHGDSLAALAHQHRNVPPPVESVDEPIRPLLAHGLAKTPGERPRSAEDFLAELEETAAAAYGPDWEERGRAGLAALAVPYLGMFPLAEPVAASATGLARTTLTPMAKLAVTVGVTLVTAAAVVSTFVIWNDPPQTVQSRRPVSSSPSPTGAPPTPTPSRTAGRPSGTAKPVQATPSPSPGPTQPRHIQRTRQPEPTRTPTQKPTREPTRKPTKEPTKQPTKVPTSTPDEPTPSPDPPETPGPGEPSEPEPSEQSSQDSPPPDGDPLISAEVRVSLGAPGNGGGLVDADIGLKVGTGLLGGVALPGTLLLGKHIATRRARRDSDQTL